MRWDQDMRTHRRKTTASASFRADIQKDANESRHESLAKEREYISQTRSIDLHSQKRNRLNASKNAPKCLDVVSSPDHGRSLILQRHIARRLVGILILAKEERRGVNVRCSGGKT